MLETLPTPFKKSIYYSLGLHAAIFIFFVIGPFPDFFGHRPLKKEDIVWVNLPKGTTNDFGTPMKKSEGLPKTTIQQQKQTLESAPSGRKTTEMTYQKKAEKKKTPQPPKKQGLPDSKVEDALSRMKRLAAKQPAAPEAAQIPDGQPGGFTFGNTTGPYVMPNDPEYVIYQAKIRQRIMNEWIIPMKFTEQEMGLLCRINVHINERGEVVKTEWETQSGNPSFDQSALRAVEKASPLDIPPDRLKYEVLNEGFVVEFKPQNVPQ